MRLMLLCFLFIGCTKLPIRSYRVPVKKNVNWSDKKRGCHTHYLNSFGLSVQDAMILCKEELGRR